MTPEKKERLQWLLEQIQIEEDQNKFTELCTQLNELLEEKQKRLAEKQTNSPPNRSSV